MTEMLEPGTEAETCSMAIASMNGLKGVIVCFDTNNQRYTLELENGNMMSLKARNVRGIISQKEDVGKDEVNAPVGEDNTGDFKSMPLASLADSNPTSPTSPGNGSSPSSVFPAVEVQPAVEEKPFVVEEQPCVVKEQSSLAEEQPSAINKQLSAIERHCSTVEEKVEEQHFVFKEQPSVDEEQHSTVKERPSVVEDQAAIADNEIAAALGVEPQPQPAGTQYIVAMHQTSMGMKCFAGQLDESEQAAVEACFGSRGWKIGPTRTCGENLECYRITDGIVRCGDAILSQKQREVEERPSGVKERPSAVQEQSGQDDPRERKERMIDLVGVTDVLLAVLLVQFASLPFKIMLAAFSYFAWEWGTKPLPHSDRGEFEWTILSSRLSSCGCWEVVGAVSLAAWGLECRVQNVASACVLAYFVWKFGTKDGNWRFGWGNGRPLGGTGDDRVRTRAERLAAAADADAPNHRSAKDGAPKVVARDAVSLSSTRAAAEGGAAEAAAGDIRNNSPTLSKDAPAAVPRVDANSASANAKSTEKDIGVSSSTVVAAKGSAAETAAEDIRDDSAAPTKDEPVASPPEDANDVNANVKPTDEVMTDEDRARMRKKRLAAAAARFPKATGQKKKPTSGRPLRGPNSRNTMQWGV